MPDMPTPATASGAPAPLPAPRVLVVLDRHFPRRRYHLALRDKGFEVTAVPHGREALAALLEGGHGLVVVETTDGPEAGTFLDVLRRYLCRLDLPVVLIPRHPGEWKAERCQAYQVARSIDRTSGPAAVVDCAMTLLGLSPPPPVRWSLTPPRPAVAA